MADSYRVTVRSVIEVQRDESSEDAEAQARRWLAALRVGYGAPNARLIDEQVSAVEPTAD